MADHSVEIARIRKILNAGATRVSNDGQTVDYDFAALRKRLRDLIADDDTETLKRPTAANINLGGF